MMKAMDGVDDDMLKSVHLNYAFAPCIMMMAMVFMRKLMFEYLAQRSLAKLSLSSEQKNQNLFAWQI